MRIQQPALKSAGMKQIKQVFLHAGPVFSETTRLDTLVFNFHPIQYYRDGEREMTVVKCI